MRSLALCTLALAVLVVACDSVHERYATLREARAVGIFERGWLPDILPRSTRDLRDSHDLDSNQSSGSFAFDPVEYAALAVHLRPVTRRDAPNAALAEMLAPPSRSDRVGEYIADGSVWIFRCRPAAGTCEYAMWPADHDSDG